MGRQLLHIDHLEVVSVCHIADGQQGEIGEVFVIDRIELIVFNQIGEMRKLKGDDPFRLEQQLHPAHKVIEVGNRARTLLPMIRSAFSIGTHLRGKARAKEFDQCGNSFCPCRFRDICRRFNAEDRDGLRDEVLQKIAIIAGNLDDETIPIEIELFGDFLTIGSGMSDPACGKG